MRGHGGLTLVEVLVALAILGIILMLVTTWQTQTLQITTRTTTLAEQFAELSDLSGFVGDRVRSALRVRVATAGLTVNSGAGNACSLSSPCLALVIPQFAAAGSLPRYSLFVYRMQARSAVTLDKVPDAWAETNVQVMREFRSQDTGSTPSTCVLATSETFDTATSASCVSMRNLATLAAVGNFQPYLVSDYLTPAQGLPAGVPPFAWTPATHSATITVQSRRQLRGVTLLVPEPEPYTLTVQARNVP